MIYRYQTTLDFIVRLNFKQDKLTLPGLVY